MLLMLTGGPAIQVALTIVTLLRKSFIGFTFVSLQCLGMDRDLPSYSQQPFGFDTCCLATYLKAHKPAATVSNPPTSSVLFFHWFLLVPEVLGTLPM